MCFVTFLFIIVIIIIRSHFFVFVADTHLSRLVLTCIPLFSAHFCKKSHLDIPIIIIITQLRVMEH